MISSAGRQRPKSAIGRKHRIGAGRPALGADGPALRAGLAGLGSAVNGGDWPGLAGWAAKAQQSPLFRQGNCFNKAFRAVSELKIAMKTNYRIAAKFLSAVILAGSTSTLWGTGFRVPDQDAFATARGEAFVATADNPSAIYYNPAGLTQLEGQNLRGGVYGMYFDPRYTSPYRADIRQPEESACHPPVLLLLQVGFVAVGGGPGRLLGLRFKLGVGHRTRAFARWRLKARLPLTRSTQRWPGRYCRTCRWARAEGELRRGGSEAGHVMAKPGLRSIPVQRQRVGRGLRCGCAVEAASSRYHWVRRSRARPATILKATRNTTIMWPIRQASGQCRLFRTKLQCECTVRIPAERGLRHFLSADNELEFRV